MQLNLQKVFIPFMLLISLTFCADFASAQSNTTPGKRLHSPATVRGFIGGESHDSYLIRARRSQVMTVQISWKRDGDNRADFTVSQSPNFFDANQIGFGKASNDNKRWTGKLPRTGDYYIYVVAHPTARYTLKVTTK